MLSSWSRICDSRSLPSLASWIWVLRLSCCWKHHQGWVGLGIYYAYLHWSLPFASVTTHSSSQRHLRPYLPFLGYHCQSGLSCGVYRLYDCVLQGSYCFSWFPCIVTACWSDRLVVSSPLYGSVCSKDCLCFGSWRAHYMMLLHSSRCFRTLILCLLLCPGSKIDSFHFPSVDKSTRNTHPHLVSWGCWFSCDSLYQSF